MKIIQKKLEFQLDKKPSGYVIRVNDEHGCILRICKVPEHLVEDKNGTLGFIDIEYPRELEITSEKHNPKYKYDCGNCKFNWNCGLTCSCVLKDVPEPPPWLVKQLGSIQKLIDNQK